MVHPLVSEVAALAAPIAAELELDVVAVVFQTDRSPPILRVDVRPRNADTDTSLDDCERMSRALEARLDASNAIAADASYILEISSPGLSEELTSDRDYESFRGFPVRAIVDPPHKGKTEWRGRLQTRDDQMLYLNQKGRRISLPREAIVRVLLDEEE